ncbi:MAG: hypothetical protein HKN16_07500 [Saprospiraceae bacterium]|nr:hypothetical protein [Saprospiraceae bacterium]
MAEAKTAKGLYDEGYKHLYAYTQMREEFFTEATLREMSKVKNRYELVSRENEIELLRAEKDLLAKEKKIKGLYWFLLFMMVAGFSGILFLLYSRWKMQSRLLSLLKDRGEKIKAQNAKLAQSNLDLQQFASVASHDLREPLRMINSYTKLLSRRYASSFDASGKEFMHFITDAATRMDRLLVDLLEYSRAEKRNERTQWVSSVDLVDNALANLKLKIHQKGVSVNYEKSHLPKLYVNKSGMVQLFQNLISNAVKFSDTESPEVIIDCAKRGHYYKFSVKDNGIGIEDNQQEKIFDMFTRLHSSQEFEGSGIGLATCKKIVERQGGEIWVESKKGQGSTFYFTIPQDVSAN